MINFAWGLSGHLRCGFPGAGRSRWRVHSSAWWPAVHGCAAADGFELAPAGGTHENLPTGRCHGDGDALMLSVRLTFGNLVTMDDLRILGRYGWWGMEWWIFVEVLGRFYSGGPMAWVYLWDCWVDTLWLQLRVGMTNDKLRLWPNYDLLGRPCHWDDSRLPQSGSIFHGKMAFGRANDVFRDRNCDSNVQLG